MTRGQWLALAIGALGVVAGVIGLVTAPQRFFQAYLTAHVFWMSVTLGCLAIAMLHRLAGGQWGVLIGRYLEAGAGTLPVLLVLFVPLLFGLRVLYAWTDPAVVAADPLLQHKQPYLNVPFFLVRSAVYFLCWAALTWLLLRWSREWAATRNPRLPGRLQRFSAVGLALLGFTTTFAAFDWLMSLEPHWYSTIYGALIAMGGVLAAFALVICAAALAVRGRARVRATARTLNDLGSLLLAFVLLWAYLAFSQYLIIWSGNIQEEVPWYLSRLAGGWQYVVLAVAALDLALPVVLLSLRDLKRSPWLLAGVALVVFIARCLDHYWLIMPAFSPASLGVHWLDVALPLGLGGFWLAAFQWWLRRLPTAARYADVSTAAAGAELQHAQP